MWTWQFQGMRHAFCFKTQYLKKQAGFHYGLHTASIPGSTLLPFRAPHCFHSGLHTDRNGWKRWCQSVKEAKSFEDVPPGELDNVQSHFFIKVRKINGEEFEPGTGFFFGK